MKFILKQVGLILFYYIVFGLIVSIFIYPSADSRYEGWLGAILGSVHGSFVLQNWVISIFNSTRLVKAVDHDTWYLVSWWFGILSTVYYLLKEPVVLYLKVKGVLNEEIF
ncbi:MAG: hypothetical protein J0L60_14800 [Ignavibacteria bacterium]|nr:hypothetical protein [Ignavibacteria bacterium]